MRCEIPAGWATLGHMNTTCPPGYNETILNLTCTGFKNERCCSQGHSGANGDCDDLLINDVTGQCALIDDAGNCTPSTIWKKTNETINKTAECPSDYSWIDMKDCPGGRFDSTGCYAPLIVLFGLMLIGFIMKR